VVSGFAGQALDATLREVTLLSVRSLLVKKARDPELAIRGLAGGVRPDLFVLPLTS